MEARLFSFLAAGLEYSYELKLFPLFQEFLNQEKHIATLKVEEFEESRRESGFINSLTEEQKKFLWLTHLDRRLHQSSFSESLEFTWYMGLSNERRLKLGVNRELLDYLGYMDTLLDRPEEHYQYQMKLKEKLQKNKLKTWSELSGFVRKNSNRSPLFSFDYEKDWSVVLRLNGYSFFYGNDKYLIYFPKTNHEMMDFGARFNTCLASCQAANFLKGKEVKFIVFKEKELFSSLTLSKQDDEIVVSMMKSYNNRNVDPNLSLFIQDKVDKLLRLHKARLLLQA